MKNTLLGAAVFGTYENVVTYLDAYNLKSTSSPDKNNLHQPPSFPLDEDAYSRMSVIQHLGAGACAGTAHGLLSISLDSTLYLYNQRVNLAQNFNKTYGSIRQHCVQQAIPWGMGYTVHHTIAHSVLFASYEATKRTLFHGIHQQRSNNDSRSEANIHENNSQNMFLNGDVIIIGLAGGIAGKIQHVISHYSEQIFNVGEDQTNTVGRNKRIVEQQLQRGNSNLAKNKTIAMELGKEAIDVTKRILIAPTVRSTIISFFPSAVGFIAFEFGKDIVATSY